MLAVMNDSVRKVEVLEASIGKNGEIRAKRSIKASEHILHDIISDCVGEMQGFFY